MRQACFWRKKLTALCLLLLAVQTTKAEQVSADEKLVVTVHVPEIVGTQRPVSLTIIAENRGMHPVGVWPPMTEWKGNLRTIGKCKSIRIEHRAFDSTEFRELALHPMLIELLQGEYPIPAVYSLQPGESLTWTCSLRQLFKFPEKDAGTYRVRVEVIPPVGKDGSMQGNSAGAVEFRVVPGKGIRHGLGEFRFITNEQELYGGAKRDANVIVRINREVEEDRRRIIASSNLRHAAGEVVLVEGDASLDDIRAFHFQPKPHLMGPYNEKHYVRKREYLAVVWIADGKLTYTTYGIHCLSGYAAFIDGKKPIPDALRAVPDFQQFCAAKTLTTPTVVKEIRKLESYVPPQPQRGPDDDPTAPPGFIVIHYRAIDNSEGTLYVDEFGKQADAPLGAKTKSGKAVVKAGVTNA